MRLPATEPRSARRHAGPALALAALLSAAGCAIHPPSAPPSAPLAACEAGDEARVRDVLYFGRNRPGGGIVDDAAWAAFLADVATPRFPAGLTVVDATGQWQGARGVIERERTAIVTLLHAGDAAARSAVEALAAEYRNRFAQEAVLRERSTVCARFR